MWKFTSFNHFFIYHCVHFPININGYQTLPLLMLCFPWVVGWVRSQGWQPDNSSRSSSMVFTPPSVPPLAGDRNLREEEGNRPTRCSEPLRSKVGGASKPSPDIVRDGTALLQLASGLRHILRDGTAWE